MFEKLNELNINITLNFLLLGVSSLVKMLVDSKNHMSCYPFLTNQIKTTFVWGIIILEIIFLYAISYSKSLSVQKVKRGVLVCICCCCTQNPADLSHWEVLTQKINQLLPWIIWMILGIWMILLMVCDIHTHSNHFSLPCFNSCQHGGIIMWKFHIKLWEKITDIWIIQSYKMQIK